MAKKTAPATKKTPLPKKTRLLSGGNPQVSMADGDAPVQAYIAAVPGWKRRICADLDALISRAIPGVSKAVKWNSPFYGAPGKGWAISYHVYTNYVKLTFFKGTSLSPVPSGGASKEGRWVNIGSDGFDEKMLTNWIKQAAELPGWMA